MKKRILKSTLLAFTGVALIAGSAAALPLTNVLQTQLDIRTLGGSSSVNVQSDMLSDSNDSAWKITANAQSAATLLFEIAGYAETNSFGIYDVNNKATTLQLFSGANSNPGNPFDGATITLGIFDNNFTVNNFVNVTAFSSNIFGYYLDVAATGDRYYSNTLLNTDQYDHMFAYRGKGDQFSVFKTNDVAVGTDYGSWTGNEYILAWEDLRNGGDQDFTDFVVMVESVEPVPEPSTMLLFGAGLIGLAGIARRKSAKK